MSRISATTRKPPTPEQIVTRQCRDYLLHRGWRAIRFQRTVVSGQFQSGEPGMPDYLFVRYAHQDRPRPRVFSLLLWIEFKGPRGRLGPKQEEWIARERLRGALVWVVDDFEWMVEQYEATFGWLHSGDAARGQLEMRL